MGSCGQVDKIEIKELLLSTRKSLLFLFRLILISCAKKKETEFLQSSAENKNLQFLL